jgi:hypothetical protein
LQDVAVLAPPDTARAFGHYTFVVADPYGGYLVSDQAAADHILLFDSRGLFVKAVGKNGDGPGEFRSVLSLAVGAGDTIHVFTTHHMLFTRDGRFVRAQYVLNGTRVSRVLSLPNGTLLLQAMVPTPDLAGRPLHILDAQGRVTKSFGALPGEYLTGQFFERFRAIGFLEEGVSGHAHPTGINLRIGATAAICSAYWFVTVPGVGHGTPGAGPRRATGPHRSSLLWLRTMRAAFGFSPPSRTPVGLPTPQPLNVLKRHGLRLHMRTACGTP